MRPLAAALAGLLLAACGVKVAEPPKEPAPAAPDITIQAEAVPLNPADPKQDRVGDFVYAGGLKLTSAQTSRLHGLSDLDVQPDGDLVAVGDEGDLLRGRLVLDGDGRPTHIADAKLTALKGLDGKPLRGKDEQDSEGLARLPSQSRMPAGALLVSFERHDRIWLYPINGGTPRPVFSPAVKFPYNEGMEALAPDPGRGRDAYITGGETTGRTWLCWISEPCLDGPTIDLAPGFGLVAIRRLPAARTAWLLRAFNPTTRSVIDLRITDAAGKTLDQMELRQPLTVDNFEGLAAVPGENGSIRFYLISDDNFSNTQRTLLLAFDWKPPTGK